MTRSTDEIINAIREVLETQKTLCSTASKFLNSKVMAFYMPHKTIEVSGQVTLKEFLCEIDGAYELKKTWEV